LRIPPLAGGITGGTAVGGMVPATAGTAGAEGCEFAGPLPRLGCWVEPDEGVELAEGADFAGGVTTPAEAVAAD